MKYGVDLEPAAQGLDVPFDGGELEIGAALDLGNAGLQLAELIGDGLLGQLTLLAQVRQPDHRQGHAPLAPERVAAGASLRIALMPSD